MVNGLLKFSSTRNVRLAESQIYLLFFAIYMPADQTVHLFFTLRELDANWVKVIARNCCMHP